MPTYLIFTILGGILFLGVAFSIVKKKKKLEKEHKKIMEDFDKTLEEANKKGDYQDFTEDHLY
ncbi:hypothetical protein [Olleya sp. R77988]|uniref:hypothetical protein n=1 Tax=Olleya sp. R77988 TaxID=3093875 RepID=UPI0037C8572E